LTKETPVEAGYDGRQIVGIDLHRRRSVVVRMAADTGQRLGTVRIDNDPLALAAEIAKAGEHPEVVLEATYGCSGRSTCCTRPALSCIWRIRESRVLATGG
jgi:hypothetical protein